MASNTISASSSSNTSYYDSVDLTTPEIAVCLEKIDRYKTSTYKFKIPVLTPYMNQDTATTKTVIQKSSNIVSENSASTGVANLSLTNYLSIKLPVSVISQYSTSGYSITGNIYGSMSTSGNHFSITSGTVKLVPIDRYIDIGSKWIVVFVGGDITKPQIIAPYTGE